MLWISGKLFLSSKQAPSRDIILSADRQPFTRLKDLGSKVSDMCIPVEKNLTVFFRNSPFFVKMLFAAS